MKLMSMRSTHSLLICAMSVSLLLPVSGAAQVLLCNVTPNTQDSYTDLLDHFDGSTLGQVYGTVSYGASVNGLGRALQFSNGSWVEYNMNGWYQWTSDYQPSDKYGAIELWIKPASTRVNSDFLVINWFNTTTRPDSGFITVLGLDGNGRLTFGDWSSINNNPNDTPFSPPHTVIPANAWTHIAYTWSPSGTAVYVNGQLEATSTLNYYPALNSTVYLYLNPWGSNVLAAVDELRVSTIGRASMMKCAN
jgi:Concanavalin A-like lectin/glucanases superfamily